ncbi:3-dehydroquinate synthase [Rubricoccus marinus]|uniref:3-dehydroquinate synthase n=1 Tax=Rubricoccus marinus TaxID=716817 RepID=A0A259U3S4_9BACT|nr:3-dehydroquinate synthase [Rubricoccus marinus]
MAKVPELAERAGLDPGPALVVTDEHVADLHLGELMEAFGARSWKPRPLVVAPGEASKSMDTYSLVMDWALGVGITRQTPVFALGGGVVGDLAGFAAATLLRGLPLVQIPTTVVAQVDSALGGKTGINHGVGKNLIGAFYPPRLVVSDWGLLRTLFRSEVRAGCAEIIKHGLVADRPLATRLQRDLGSLMGLRDPIAPELLRDAAAVKATIVSGDEREAGRRALLNFGHTFGHAIEKVAGYGRILHGEAVALGMRAALHLSASLKAGSPLAPEADLPAPFAEADALVRDLRIRTTLDGLETPELMVAMQSDKKRAAAGLRFIVLDDIGAGRVADGVPVEMVEAAWAYARRVGAGG